MLRAISTRVHGDRSHLLGFLVIPEEILERANQWMLMNLRWGALSGLFCWVTAYPGVVPRAGVRSPLWGSAEFSA